MRDFLTYVNRPEEVIRAQELPGIDIGIGCIAIRSSGKGPRSRQADPRHRRLALKNWNMTSVEVQRYQRHTVGLSSSPSTGSGIELLVRGRTIVYIREVKTDREIERQFNAESVAISALHWPPK